MGRAHDTTAVAQAKGMHCVRRNEARMNQSESIVDSFGLLRLILAPLFFLFIACSYSLISTAEILKFNVVHKTIMKPRRHPKQA